jgi:hypothetical protein
MNRQGWAFFPEGAARMALIILSSASSGIGVEENLRMLRRAWIAWYKSIRFSFQLR